MKEQPKFPSWIRNRDLPYVSEEQLDIIENQEKETPTLGNNFRRELLDHRNIIGKSKRQYSALVKAKEEVKRLQRELHNNKNESSRLWTTLSPFKNRYSFTTCITIQRIEKEVKIGGEYGEKKIRKYEYFNLGINRPNQRKPVNVFLGSEKKFVDYLLKVFPEDKKRIQEDWKSYARDITEDIRCRPQNIIQDYMVRNPIAFSGLRLKKEDVFRK